MRNTRATGVGTSLLVLLALFRQTGASSRCSPDPCQMGFCFPDGSDDGYFCDCEPEYEGTNCDTKVELPCHSACGEKGACRLVEENGGAPTPRCVCELGFTGETCEDEIPGFNWCDVNQCNGRGTCDSTTSEASCTCDEGWGGEFCDMQLRMCTYDFLLDLSSYVFVASEDPNTGTDCRYFLGLLWTETTRNNETELNALCTCLQWIVENEPRLSENMGCVLEEEFPLSLKSEYHIHCNNCTDDAIADMKTVLAEQTPECWMFIEHRDEQALAWRTRTKCTCLLSLGDRQTAAELVYCPFTSHAARTDMIAYDNCKSDDVEICHFDEVKDWVMGNLTIRHPDGVPICEQAFKVYFESIPNELKFSAIVPNWCPCYDIIAEYWAEGLEVLNCNAVTFYEFTLYDLFVMYCYNPVFQKRELIWDLFETVVPVSTFNYPLSDICYNSIPYVGAYATNPTINGTRGYLERVAWMVCTCVIGITKLEEDDTVGAKLAELSEMDMFHFDFEVLVDKFLGAYLDFTSRDCVPSAEISYPTPAPVEHHIIHNVKFRRAELDDEPPGGTLRRSTRRGKRSLRRRDENFATRNEDHPYFFNTPAPTPGDHHRAYAIANITLGVATGILFLLNCYLTWQKHSDGKKSKVIEPSVTSLHEFARPGQSKLR